MVKVLAPCHRAGRFDSPPNQVIIFSVLKLLYSLSLRALALFKYVTVPITVQYSTVQYSTGADLPDPVHHRVPEEAAKVCQQGRGPPGDVQPRHRQVRHTRWGLGWGKCWHLHKYYLKELFFQEYFKMLNSFLLLPLLQVTPASP